MAVVRPRPRTCVGFFVSAYVARVYGPETFGIYSYGLALVYLFAVPGHAGLNALVVKRLVDAETNNSVIMGTSLVIKGWVFGWPFASAWLCFFPRNAYANGADIARDNVP